ncbi:hypothetical protein H650_23870 [Enterobacter sp. R4-368]|nr:hypothetical protein H650_23870 [Enterobacter sp. R4-368]
MKKKEENSGVKKSLPEVAPPCRVLRGLFVCPLLDFTIRDLQKNFITAGDNALTNYIKA